MELCMGEDGQRPARRRPSDRWLAAPPSGTFQRSSSVTVKSLLHKTGDQLLEGGSVQRRASLGLAEELIWKVDRGSHKSIFTA